MHCSQKYNKIFYKVELINTDQQGDFVSFFSVFLVPSSGLTLKMSPVID